MKDWASYNGKSTSNIGNDSGNFDETRDALNGFIHGFPIECRRILVKHFKKLKLKIFNNLQKWTDNSTEIMVLSDISSIIAEGFQKIAKVIEESSLFHNERFNLLEDDKSNLLSLIEEHISFTFHDDIFKIIASFHDHENIESEKTSLVDIMDAYGRWITPKAINLNLDENREPVRRSLCSGIRELSMLTKLKSSNSKLQCLLKCFHYIKEALEYSSVNDPSADDIIPVIIYILIKLKITDIHYHLTYIDTVFPSKEVLETNLTGYVFVTFSAAIEAIKLGLLPTVPQPVEPSSPKGSRHLEHSVTIIQDEVNQVIQKQIKALREFVLENKDLILREKSEAEEQKAWKVIKWIPGLNIGYGAIRSAVYGARGNKKEAVQSVVGSIGGVLGLGAGIAGGFVGGPVIVPILVSMISGTAANQIGTGGGEIIADVFLEPGHFESLSDDGREKEIYEKILRDIAVVGGLYSGVRAIVYAVKGDKDEAKRSGLSLGVNLGASGVGIGVGLGMARLASSLATKIPQGAAAAAIVETSDQVGKPVVSEISEAFTQFGIKILTHSSTNAAARGGAHALSGAILKKAFINEESEDGYF